MTKGKKDKDSMGQEGTSAAVGGVADSCVPTMIMINAGEQEVAADMKTPLGVFS